MTYYTTLMILLWMTLAILCILALENDRYAKEKKRLLCVTYILVAAAAAAEWLGVQLTGNLHVSPWLLRAVKLLDYTLTPIAGGAIILQFRAKNIWDKILFGVIGFNTLFQIVSFFTGWMVAIDATNHYSHGPAYNVYVIIYLVIFFIVIVQFAIHGRKFRRQNALSLYATVVMVLTGIILQEASSGGVRTAYAAMTLALAMLYIHDSEFVQLETDERIQEQMIRISEDPLTGIASRYAYTEAVGKLSEAPELPRDLVVFSIDINGLKKTNDTLGHHAGDELICGAADCVTAVFGKCGKCYRTGGDEFIVLANVEKEQIEPLLADLEQATQEWQGKEVPALSVSVGYAEAANAPEATAENLITAADREMYRAKTTYYLENNIERRVN